MTLQEMLNYCRAIMNEESALTPNWSDAEIIRLINKRTIEASTYLRQMGSASALSVAGTATYAATTPISYVAGTAIFINTTRVWYAGRGLKYITARQLESRRPTGTITTGLPREWTLSTSDFQITLSPTPDTSGDLITVFGELRAAELTTANLPASASPNSVLPILLFHGAICDGVIADMYAKDLNINLFDRYEKRWNDIHVPRMIRFGMRHRRRNSPQTVVDSDSTLETEFGVI